jgi:hypothetical protein
VWQAKGLTNLAIGHYTKETSTKMPFATWYQKTLLLALNNVGVAQENLTIMYLKKYVDNDLWESLHWVLVAKRKYEDPTKYLSKLHNTGKYNQAPQEPTRSYHARLQAVWAKAYPERKGDPAEDPENCTRFVAGLYPQYSKYLINERKDQLPMKGIFTAVGSWSCRCPYGIHALSICLWCLPLFVCRLSFFVPSLHTSCGRPECNTRIWIPL